MISRELLLISLLATVRVAAGDGVISGVVVNGSDPGQPPLAGVEVVLRAGDAEGFIPVATTTSDAAGRFSFADLPIGQPLIYLPGANRGEVHYPGPRLRLDQPGAKATVRLVAYESIGSPSPLVSRQHEIQISAQTGVLLVRETLVIDNPSQTTFVGLSDDHHPPITLRLSLPPGFETVTFENEFFGRQFLVKDNELLTTMPFTPGPRELSFFYRLPVEQRASVYRRPLNQPTSRIVMRVASTAGNDAICNLPKVAADQSGEQRFEYQGKPLPAGHHVELELTSLPVRWESYGRWFAPAALVALLAGAVASARWRQKSK